MENTIYFVFKDKCPDQDYLKKINYNDLEEFIEDNTHEEAIIEDISGAYEAYKYTSFNDYFDNQEEILSKIKNELNIIDSIAPVIFKEDTSFENDNYMKITTNKEQLRTFLKFISNLNEEFLNIHKEQINNTTGNLPSINQLDDPSSAFYKDLTHIRDTYTDPFKQDCAFIIMDLKSGDIDYLDKNDFIDKTISYANKECDVTYYVSKKLCAEYW